MDCREILPLLPLYMDGILDGEEKRAVEEHLKSCDLCKKELGILEKIQAEMAALPEIEPSYEFKKELHEKLVKEKNKKTSVYLSASFKKYFSLAASAAIIAFSVTALNTEFYKPDNSALTGNEKIAVGETYKAEESDANENEVNKKVPELSALNNKAEAKEEVKKTDVTVQSKKVANEEETAIPSVASIEADAKAEKTEEKAFDGETEVQKADSVELAEESADMANAPIARASGGGGGGSSAKRAVSPTLEKITLRISFPNQDESYLEILSGYESEDGVCKVPIDEFYDVVNKLTGIPDALASFSKEDMTEEYNKLLEANSDGERISEIEEIVKYGYVIVK